MAKTSSGMVRKSLLLSFVVGMVVGMGNGSVFGIYLMANLGRGKFSNWGGWDSYTPTSFNGFMTWTMLVFGVAFIAILLMALHGHDKMAQKRVGGTGH
ncbi:MAG: hypothetical protein ABIQ54_01025 [Gammaproteobacteria bacterium]